MDPEMKITLDSSNENLPIYPNNNNPVHNPNTSNQKVNSNNKKRKADVWNFFTQEDGIAVCRCSKVYKYQSTNGTSTLRHHAMKCSMCPDFPGNDSSNQNEFGTIKQTIPDYKPVYKTQQRKSGSFRSNSGLQVNDHLMNTIPDQLNSSGTVNVANTFPSIPFMMNPSKQVATAPKRPSYNVQMKTVRSLIELMFQENFSYQIVESRSFQQFMFNIKNDISAINKEILATEMSKYLDYLHKTIEYNLQLNFPVAQQDEQLQSPMKTNVLTQNKCNLMVRLIYLNSTKGISRPYLAINISFIDDNWNLQNFLLSVVNLNTDNVNNVSKNAFEEPILSKEYLYHVVMKEIERFRLFPFIHSIQFDLQNYMKNMKMKQFFQLKWKELTDPNSSNSSNAVPLILSPLPTNVVIDMIAIDLLSVLSSTNFLSMIRQIISLVHYSTPEQKRFYEWILWNSPELRTEFSDAKKAILDNCGLDYSLFSFYNKKMNANGEDEEGCSYLRNGSGEWERSYQMCTHFIHNLKVYQRYFHLQFNKINSSSASTTAMEMFSPLIRRFHEFLSSYSSLDDWNELKNLYQLMDWCFHVKKNNLNIYKPLDNNQKSNYATNHLLFHQFYDFNHYMKQIIHSNTRTNVASIVQLKQLHDFYSDYLNIYDPSFRNGSENNCFFHSYSNDQEVYYITHLLDPRFRFNFLQELSTSHSQKNRTAQTNEKTKYDELSHQFTLLFLEYQQRYSRALPENPLIDETAAQEMMNDLQGSLSEGGEENDDDDEDRNNDNEDEENNHDSSNNVQKRLSYSSLEQSPPYDRRHHQPAAAFHLNKSTGNESLQQMQSQSRPQRDSYSFGNTMATNWLKKKSLAMKYSYFDQLRNNQNHSDKHHDSYDANDIYELNYYIKENQFFFHHLQHEKFHYQNYISHFYQRNNSSNNNSITSSFSPLPPAIQSSSSSHQQQHQFDSFSMNQEAAITTSISDDQIHTSNINRGNPINPPIAPEFDLLSWWNEYSYQFSYLSIIARHYLSIPAMSTITNFVTGGDWMDDWLASSGQGSSSHHHGYELQSNEFFAPFGCGGSENDSLISDEFIRDLLLGHHWYNVIQRNQWKPPTM
jgi:hypothetical protein